MYPRVSDFFKDFLGFDWPFPNFPIYSYGFMVAIAILTASWVSGLELRRLQRVGRLGMIPMKQKNKETGKIETVSMPPSDLMGTITIIAAVAGVLGSKLFFILEEPGDFWVKALSPGGLTFYGGLLLGTAAVLWYIRSKKLPIPVFMDALAPGLILAYGIGRIGCHLAGDGDWGFASNMALKPSFIPNFLWAETYSRNILNQSIPAPGVYPAPLYEFLMGVAAFAILWLLRKHPYKAGWLFSLYLILNGLERSLIEKIRVNIHYNIFGMNMSQAEIIALGLIILGCVGLYLTWKKREDVATPDVPPQVPQVPMAANLG
jgi:phosphatidylglycerol:prolipoprotein diacylglycerol transferase